MQKTHMPWLVPKGLSSVYCKWYTVRRLWQWVLRCRLWFKWKIDIHRQVGIWLWWEVPFEEILTGVVTGPAASAYEAFWWHGR